MSLADYVVTEAGFGADLGAEKFLDIKCRKANLNPNCIVLVATIKALKYNGGVSKENVLAENISALKEGLPNLGRHIENLKKYGVPVVVCLNKYDTDTVDEIDEVYKYCSDLGVEFSISTAYLEGGKGAIELAKKVITCCKKKSKFKLLYKDNLSLSEKIENICSEIYRASDVKYSEIAVEKLKKLELDGKGSYPICIAKTQYSFSDDASKLCAPVNYSVLVRDVCLYNGAEFVTVLLGNIMTMPGLPVVPNYEKIDFVDDKIVGLD